MQISKLVSALGLIGLLFVGLPSPSHASGGSRPRFTNRDFAGHWAGLTNGTLAGQTYANVGVFESDGSGVGTISAYNNLTPGLQQLTCTYDVQPNGLATGLCTDSVSGLQVSLYMVISDFGNRVDFFESAPAVAFFATGSTQRQ